MRKTGETRSERPARAAAFAADGTASIDEIHDEPDVVRRSCPANACFNDAIPSPSRCVVGPSDVERAWPALAHGTVLTGR